MEACVLGNAPVASSTSLYEDVAALRQELLGLETELAAALVDFAPEARESARNLVHYLALRRRDRRGLQERLADAGLSSLGRSEAHVLHTVEAVLGTLARLDGRAAPAPDAHGPDRARGRRLLLERTDRLLGKAPATRHTRILVTLPREAASDAMLVRRLLVDGMDAARINCAHDDAAVWRAMAEQVRRASEDTGRPCRVLMDLGGPKLRTGVIGEAGQRVRWRPERDDLGRVVEPARVWLVSERALAAGTLAPASPSLALADDQLAELRPGQKLTLTDARGKRRHLLVGPELAGMRLATSDETTYLLAGESLELELGTSAVLRARVLAPPEPERVLTLARGDLLVLTRAPEPGRPARRLDHEHVLPARVSCTLPEVFAAVRVGERLLLDDGKIAGVIEVATPDELHVRVVATAAPQVRLGADKGINLPDSTLDVPALTHADLAALDLVVECADLVGLSFVRRAEDVEELRAQLARRGGDGLGVVLKIETRAAFEALPALLLSSLRAPTTGIMIARGDLAVECGYERLAELQEEILWLCEAAHVPVIWATQVLESLAKHGAPSRAEITDAAMGERAECVMLNKGEFVGQAVRVLDDIVTRMELHQDKKSARLRPLRVSADSVTRLSGVRS